MGRSAQAAATLRTQRRRRTLTATAATGGYLPYYWATAPFTPTRTRAHDPLVGAIDRISATVQSWATSSAGIWVLLVAAGSVALVLLHAVWRWARTDPTPDHIHRADPAHPLRSRS